MHPGNTLAHLALSFAKVDTLNRDTEKQWEALCKTVGCRRHHDETLWVWIPINIINVP